MGVYGKLLNKHYTPPQRKTRPQELQQIPGKQEDARTLSSENAKTLPRDNAKSLSSEVAKTLPRDNAKAEQRKLARAQGLSLYEDQLSYLRYHKALMQLENKKIDIVEMIRDAVDTYITILKKKKENP